MDQDRLYYSERAADHRARAQRAASDPARVAHLALATAYERRSRPEPDMLVEDGRRAI